MNPEPRLVQVRKNILKQNDIVARELRQRFRDAGVFVVSLVSSPGAGKTSFLERTLTELKPRYRVAALVGDLATQNDADRLARSKAPVKQITTGTVCHLEAAMIRSALEGWDLDSLDFLFVENVGNLVCPASYDLGESLRLVLISVTESDDGLAGLVVGAHPEGGILLYSLIRLSESRSWSALVFGSIATQMTGSGSRWIRE